MRRLSIGDCKCVGPSGGMGLLARSTGGEAAGAGTPERGDVVVGEVGEQRGVARAMPVRTGGGGAGRRIYLPKNAAGGGGAGRPRMDVDPRLCLAVSSCCCSKTRVVEWREDAGADAAVRGSAENVADGG